MNNLFSKCFDKRTEKVIFCLGIEDQIVAVGRAGSGWGTNRSQGIICPALEIFTW